LPVKAPHPHPEERRAAARLEAWATHPSVVPSEAEGPLFHAETREREDRSLHAALRALVETTAVRGPVFSVYERCESRRRPQAPDPSHFPQNPNRRKPTLNRRRSGHSPRHTAIACISRARTCPQASATADRRALERGIASPNRIVSAEQEPTCASIYARRDQSPITVVTDDISLAGLKRIPTGTLRFRRSRGRGQTNSPRAMEKRRELNLVSSKPGTGHIKTCRTPYLAPG
jgi:hypothetical protein